MEIVKEYDLSIALNESHFDSLLEVINSDDMVQFLSEGVLDLPKNKIKALAKKLTVVLKSKDPKTVESFVKRHKKFAKSPKEIEAKAMKLAKSLGIDENEAKRAKTSIMKSIGAILHLGGLINPFGLVIFLLVLLIAAIRGKSMDDVMEKIISDIKKSVKKDDKGAYDFSFKTYPDAIMLYIGGLIGSLIGAAFGSSLILGLSGIAVMAGLLLLIISVLSFLIIFFSTAFRA